MSPCERPAADASVERQASRSQLADVNRAFHVAQPAPLEVAARVWSQAPGPAEVDIAGGVSFRPAAMTVAARRARRRTARRSSGHAGPAPVGLAGSRVQVPPSRRSFEQPWDRLGPRSLWPATGWRADPSGRAHYCQHLCERDGDRQLPRQAVQAAPSCTELRREACWHAAHADRRDSRSVTASRRAGRFFAQLSRYRPRRAASSSAEMP
jgi:hypothetical protein